MTDDLMRYDVLTLHALRNVVKLALQRIAREGGLPGEHHFFISFDTNYAGVSLSPRLKEKYPQDMTIVLQHQFWNLIVTDTQFEVELSFDNISERMVIPYAAIKAFFDPTVQFALQFETGTLETDEDAPADTAEDAAVPAEASVLPASPEAAPGKASNDDTTVVSLDAFRKK